MGIMADVLVRGYVGWNSRSAPLVLEPGLPKVHGYTNPTWRQQKSQRIHFMTRLVLMEPKLARGEQGEY